MPVNQPFSSNRTHHTLMLHGVRVGDLGNYECVARNSIGESRGSIYLSGQPYKVEILETSFTSVDHIQLSWRTESIAPVTMTTIHFKVSSTKPLKSNRHLLVGIHNVFMVSNSVPPPSSFKSRKRHLTMVAHFNQSEAGH